MIRRKIRTILLIFMIISTACNSIPTTDHQFDVNKMLTFAMSQYSKAVNTLTDTTRIPTNGNADGTWIQKETSDWVSGFFAGILWDFYEYTNNSFWEKQARRWNAALEKEKFNTKTHDLGFMLYNSFGTGYRLTRDENYKAILLLGAESLITRFNPNVGTIMSWNSIPENHLTIIDNMMNLEYLCWATKVSGDRKYLDIATSHANLTLENCFREDGSSYHVINYDPQTGEVKEKKTKQEAANNLRDLLFKLYLESRKDSGVGLKRIDDNRRKMEGDECN